MTDNEKLARWQGARDCRGSKNNKSKWKWPTSYNPNLFYYKALPDYLNDDAAAMSLLDTLVEKGFVWFLGVDTDELGEITDIRCKVRHKDSTASINKYADTRREAVVEAVLELIKEDV